MSLVGQSAECLVWNTVFSFYCAIGRQFGKLLVRIAPTGGEEILQAYLAQTKIIAFGNKRPSVLQNVRLITHRSIQLGLCTQVGKFWRFICLFGYIDVRKLAANTFFKVVEAGKNCLKSSMFLLPPSSKSDFGFNSTFKFLFFVKLLSNSTS